MRSLSNRGTRICLIALVITAMGCQNQRKFAENRVLLQQSMDNNTERMVSLIEKLEENQQNMNEDIRSLKAAQHNIATEVIPAQRKLASQITETTEFTRKDQADLRMTLQGASLELIASQDRLQKDLAALQQDLNNNTEKTVSLIQRLEDDQRAINEEVVSLQTDQRSIMNQVGPAQQQLADQIAATTKMIRQDKSELKRTLQAANAQLVQQVKGMGERQQHLETTTETIQENGKALQRSHDECLVKLADLNRAYQARQEQLDLMKGHMATLDASVLAVLTGLSQFESSLKEDLNESRTAQNERIQRAEQTLQQKVASLDSMLAKVGDVQKTLLTLLQDVDKPTKTPDKASVQATEFFSPKSEDERSTPHPQNLEQSQTASPAPPFSPHE